MLEFLLFRLGSFSSIRAYIRDVTAAAGARKKSANQRSRFSNKLQKIANGEQSCWKVEKMHFV